ncbi:MAG: hypothetical protein VB070_00935 [Clostridiaceae bacterium]|nr:hypothetical protein [Clostridiaceae bacterium]
MNQNPWPGSGLDPEKAHCLAGLSRPELMNIPLCQSNEADPSSFGCDQDWYSEAWQRQAGCGPCTSATMLLYLARSQPFFRPLYPLIEQNHDQANFTLFMEKIWHYVTPGRMGVNEASMLTSGVARFADSYAIALESAVFPVPGQMNHRKPLSSFVQFIADGLNLDSPVAFLNLSNGRLDNLDSWHWITLVALYEYADQTIWSDVSDSGERKLINLSLWYQTSRLGGAAAYFYPAAPHADDEHP